MSVSSSVYNQIAKEYDNIRNESKRVLKERQHIIYKKIPRIQEIDENISHIGINITKAIIMNPNKSEKLILGLKEENSMLINEKKELLRKYEYKENYLDENYTCNKCKDTGYVNTEMCGCMRQKIINRLYIQSNLKDTLLSENLDTFDIRYYSDVVDEVEGISPRKNIERVVDSIHRFSKNFDTEFTNMIFYGKSGCGKTFMCNCVAKEILDKSRNVLYLTAFQLFRMVEEKYFNKNVDEEIYDYLDLVSSVDLLIIDDLGTEISTIVTSSEFYNFINIRLLNKKPTVISTNLAPIDLIKIYSERVVSRIQGNYELFKFFGNDVRVKKKYKTT